MNDSIWAVVAGTVKGFNLPIDYVLYDMSYVNLIMFGAVLPSYHSQTDGKAGDKDKQEEIRVDDPTMQARARQIIDSLV